MFRTHRLRALLALTLFCSAGCPKSDNDVKTQTDSRSPAQYFKEEQAATVTPHGRIRTDSVTERNGRIEYGTDNGMKWAVSYSKRADGTYRYDTPERIDK